VITSALLFYTTSHYNMTPTLFP